MAGAQLLPRADGDKLRDDWEGNLRRDVPKSFIVVAGVLLVAVLTVAVVQFQYIEQAASQDLGFELVSGATVMLGKGVGSTSSLHAARLQSLAEETADSAKKEDEGNDEVIRFENDYKVGGGDLEVPVSMVDYSNLGEGSIVDQRYPRRLPGADELEAEWNSLLDWDWNVRSEEPEKEDENDKKLEGMGVNVNGHYQDDEDKKEQAKADKDAKLEGMGVNVNGHLKDLEDEKEAQKK